MPLSQGLMDDGVNLTMEVFEVSVGKQHRPRVQSIYYNGHLEKNL